MLAVFVGVAPGASPDRGPSDAPSSPSAGDAARAVGDVAHVSGHGDGTPSRTAVLTSLGVDDADMSEPLPIVDGTVRLDVPLLAQNPELPNGCEATSLTMLLDYLSFDATKTEIAYDYMPRGDLVETPTQVLAPDPETTYIGDPGVTGQGYYILAPGLVRTADRYLRAASSDMTAGDITGADEERLVYELAHGNPVVVWITIDYGDAEYIWQNWTNASTGGPMEVYANLHCVLLVGFTGDAFLINDPLRDGVQTVDRGTFMHAYGEIGSRAVVIERR